MCTCKCICYPFWAFDFMLDSSKYVSGTRTRDVRRVLGKRTLQSSEENQCCFVCWGYTSGGTATPAARAQSVQGFLGSTSNPNNSCPGRISNYHLPTDQQSMQDSTTGWLRPARVSEMLQTFFSWRHRYVITQNNKNMSAFSDQILADNRRICFGNHAKTCIR